MAEYGNIFTASDMRNAIRSSNANAPWSELYTATDMAYQQASSKVQYDYAQQVANAYITSKKQASTIYGSNLTGSSKRELLSDIDSALAEAYDTYQSQQLSNMQALNANVAEQYKAIDDRLMTTSQSMADYANASIGYLQWLDEQLGSDALMQDSVLNRYYTQDGLMTSNQMSTAFFDYNTKTGQYDLNEEGMRYFDVIENYMASTNPEYSFGQYLKSQNIDLFNWATSVDEITGVTGSQAFRNMIDLAEYAYSPFAYSSESDINAAISQFNIQRGDDITDETYAALQKFIDTNKLDITISETDKTEISKLQQEYSNLINTANSTKAAAQVAANMQRLEDADRLGAKAKELSEKADKTNSLILEKYNKIVSDINKSAQGQRRYNLKNKTVLSGETISKTGDTTSIVSNAGETFSLINTRLPDQVYAVKNKNRRNVNVEFNGDTYKMEMSADTLDDSQAQIARNLIKSSRNRDAQTGDIVVVKGVMYICTNDGTFRELKDRTGGSGSDNELLSAWQTTQK